MEQKLKKVTDDIGYKSNTKYKVIFENIEDIISTSAVQNLFRWKEGPVHNAVKPVLIEFHEAKDRNDLYSTCKEGLKKTGLVMTEDSRLYDLDYYKYSFLLISAFHSPLAE